MAVRSAVLKKKARHVLIIGIFSTALSIAFWAPGIFENWELSTWDWRVKCLAEPGRATDQICLILLDQNSLDWAEEVMGLSWPWPRELYAAILNYCKRMGVRSLAFDVLFSEPSAYYVSDDVKLNNAIAEFKHCAIATTLSSHGGNHASWPESISPPGFHVSGLDRWLDTTQAPDIVFSHATLITTELSGGTPFLCNVQMKPDADAEYRRAKLFGVFDGRHLPTLGIGTYLAETSSENAEIKPGTLTIDNKTIHIDRQGNAVLRFRGPIGTYRTFSAAEVIQSELRLRDGETPTIQDGGTLKDKYVLFGFSAPGLLDNRPTPLDAVYPGVGIHATILDNFLSEDFMQMAPVWATVIFILFLSFSGTALISLCDGPFKIAIAGCAFSAIPVAVPFLAYHMGYWLPMVVCLAATAIAIVSTIILQYTAEGRQKRYIKNAFQQYLSPAVIDQLIQHPEKLSLGGERRELTIFFSDLQGFTSISEGLDPEVLTQFLNDYLSAMTEIIHEENGTVDKYEGDAIIAFWNAPLAVPDHMERTVRAALRCQKKLADLRPHFLERIGREVHMRIGINSGYAVVGNLGSRTRFDYTMLGDAVNLAARLEGTNKQFGLYTLISETTRTGLGNTFAAREIARVAVVGRKEPVTVFEPMLHEIFKEKKAIYDSFATGLDLYYQGNFEKARETFSQTRNDDPASAAYEKKCRQLMENPPEKWDGIWVMTSK